MILLSCILLHKECAEKVSPELVESTEYQNTLEMCTSSCSDRDAIGDVTEA